MLDPKVSKELYPDIEVTGVRSFVTQTAEDALDLDRFEQIGLVNLDVQGAEVNVREIYRGGASFADLDAFLAARGFVLVDSYVLWRVGLGDALWMRPGAVPRDEAGRRRRRRLRALPSQAKYLVWWLVRGRRKH